MWRPRSVPRAWHRPTPPAAAEFDDALLVEGLRRRDPAALGALHARYSSGIYNLALRMVRHGADAEDVTQDVLLRAFERLPQQRPVDLQPWLYRITVNRCYDVLRAASRRPDGDGDGGAEIPARVDTYAQSQLVQLFERSLDALTDRQRAAMLLKDVHGLSLPEVAGALQITPGSAEVLLARARNAFRARFDELCQDAGRPTPSWGVIAALPAMLPHHALPPALHAPPLAPAVGGPAAGGPPAGAPAPFAPSLPPAAAAGIPASLAGSLGAKVAVLMIAAGATATTFVAHGPGLHAAPGKAMPTRAAAVAPGFAHGPTTRGAAARSQASLVAAVLPRSGPSAPPVATGTPAPPVATGTPTPSPVPSPTPTSTATPTPQPSPGHKGASAAARARRVIKRLKAGLPVRPGVVAALAMKGLLPQRLLGTLALEGKLTPRLTARLALAGKLPIWVVNRLAREGALSSAVAGRLALKGALRPRVVRLLALQGALPPPVVNRLAAAGAFSAGVLGRLALSGVLRVKLMIRLALAGRFPPQALRRLANQGVFPRWVIKRLVAAGLLPHRMLKPPAPEPSPSPEPSASPTATPTPSPTPSATPTSSS